MNQDELKESVAIEAIQYIEDDTKVGLGTGSTMYYAIKHLGERVKEGLNIVCVPTSEKTAEWAQKFEIPLSDFSEIRSLDIAIDGADEVDENLQLIKGGGGALLREKIVADAAKKFIVIVDESKVVKILGKFKLPIEVIPFGWKITAQSIESLGCKAILRKKEEEIFVTDNQNYILDCDFSEIHHPENLNHALKSIVGVVETGLFINMTKKVLVSRSATNEINEINI
ncbi:ribose-5-phosphate isomerase RpiA [Staphylococcus lentus]|uniref:ribose-5-phosphate isomerase RpiA n=1 Tax=Mammaliicoccus lentus TaxID=42858 RepID=UPI0018842D7E|nr:ribose-5-phosphate isomerase RpiA [Mammaliicoccus lentus]MBF0841165.1 ribose-5-phosphate isomerase RpiA [Mammaliicoccus lentus]